MAFPNVSIAAVLIREYDVKMAEIPMKFAQADFDQNPTQKNLKKLIKKEDIYYKKQIEFYRWCREMNEGFARGYRHLNHITLGFIIGFVVLVIAIIIFG